jgi:hypothetical protein
MATVGASRHRLFRFLEREVGFQGQFVLTIKTLFPVCLVAL